MEKEFGWISKLLDDSKCDVGGMVEVDGAVLERAVWLVEFVDMFGYSDPKRSARLTNIHEVAYMTLPDVHDVVGEAVQIADYHEQTVVGGDGGPIS